MLLHRARLPMEVSLLLLAHVSAEVPGQPDLPVADDAHLVGAVAAGTRVLGRLSEPPVGAVARAGNEVLAAAATAATAAGTDLAADLDVVLDLAGTLAVVGPPAPVTAGADARAGHVLAVGWLSVRLLTAGLVAHRGAALATTATVTGSEPSWPRTWS